MFDKLTVMHCGMLFTGVKGGVYKLRLLKKGNLGIYVIIRVWRLFVCLFVL